MVYVHGLYILLINSIKHIFLTQCSDVHPQWITEHFSAVNGFYTYAYFVGTFRF